MKKAALHNLGCKVNAYETEAMQQLLLENGYEIVPFSERADVYVINTCSVTSMADKKSRQMLHRARKRNPDSIVVAAGCYVQTSEQQALADGTVDILIGNNKKHDLIQMLEAFERGRRLKKSQGGGRKAADGEQKKSQGTETADKAVRKKGPEMEAADGEGRKKASVRYRDIVDIDRETEYEELYLSRTAEHTRAFIKVQDGCNQFCSYCIIPYARGRVRSRGLTDVVAEVERLAGNGYREVVLTGIHLSSYGVDNGENLLHLIQCVHQVEGIRRIRLGSLEPKIVTEEFARELAALPKLCPHFHLSLQSGCDATLRRMNRKYTCQEYRQGCGYLRTYFEHPAITTDVIVGFPGETEEEFAATRAFLQEIAFFEVHIFKYSRRKGTKAADMLQQVSEEIKNERSSILMEDMRKLGQTFARWYQGKTVEVLMEEQVRIEGQTYLTGYTPQYIRAALPGERNEPNRMMSGRVEDVFSDHILLLSQNSTENMD